VVTDERDVLGLKKAHPSLKKQQGSVEQLTPFMRGMREAGSVDIEASSKKTTGKSMTFSE